jgi:hypothetical protein
MDKLLPIIIFLVLCGGYSFSEETNKTAPKQELFIYGFDTGIFGIDMSYGKGGTENVFDFKLNANLAEFYIENTTTGLGASFFPFNYSYSVKSNEHTLSFTKLYLYWNLNEIFKLNSKKENDYTEYSKITFGPFFSMQAFNLVNFENISSNISYSAGIKYAVKYFAFDLENRGNFKVTYFSSNIEFGYNYYNNRHSIYFTIGLSPAITAMFPLAYMFIASGGMIAY